MSAFDQQLCDSGEECDITPDCWLDVERCDLRSEKHASDIRGDFEVLQTDFFCRIDDDDFSSSPPQVGEESEKSRMVAGWICADEENEITFLDVVEVYGCGAGAK